MGSADIKGGPAMLCNCIPSKIEALSDGKAFSLDFEFGQMNYVLAPADYLIPDVRKKPDELQECLLAFRPLST